ncbi:putative lipoprotein [Enterococcus faecalis NY9]|nr:putative lipoprotein [Enterococcus faecalis NY9]
MKKFFLVILLGLLVVFTACGSSEKADKNTQAVIDEVVKYETEVNNTSLEEGQKPYKYTEKDFSFLIYKDKDVNRYIMDTWIPFRDKSNKFQYYYSYNENKELNRTDYESDFKDWKASGNYELVYKSGKFKE